MEMWGRWWGAGVSGGHVLMDDVGTHIGAQENAQHTHYTMYITHKTHLRIHSQTHTHAHTIAPPYPQTKQGDIIICDTCPATFHVRCAGLAAVPDGDFHCPACRCAVCGNATFRGQYTPMCRVCGCFVWVCGLCVGGLFVCNGCVCVMVVCVYFCMIVIMVWHTWGGVGVDRACCAALYSVGNPSHTPIIATPLYHYNMTGTPCTCRHKQQQLGHT